MRLFSFGSWAERYDDPSLKDAWLSSHRARSAHDQSWSLGHCELCQSDTGFRLAKDSPEADPDLRESLLCTACANNSRVRAALGLLRPVLQTHTGPRPANLYVTEQVTPTFIWMQRNLQARVRGSEFEPSLRKRWLLRSQLAAAGGRGFVRFEDVTRLTFKAGSLDAIVSFDVLEHVPNYRSAIGEFARTLRPGGICIATFPFTDGADTIVRARFVAGGSIEHLLTPEYHGDPISGGVLCYYHFGWDILDVFRDAGFTDVRMVMPWDHKQGYFYGLWTLVATR